MPPANETAIKSQTAFKWETEQYCFADSTKKAQHVKLVASVLKPIFADEGKDRKGGFDFRQQGGYCSGLKLGSPSWLQ